MNIHYGCGRCAPKEWTNFDTSPTITLQRLPVVGLLFRGGIFPDFPENIKKGNIAKGLPVKDGSAQLVYCSHVLEHLTLEEFRAAVINTHKMLAAGGVFRFVLPDLEYYATEYLNSSSPERASEFMKKTLLGSEKRRKDFAGVLREWFGGSKHFWMWDYVSIQKELKSAGFKDIRRASFGDSGHPAFQCVEDEGRWDRCLGVECRK